jgi:hypothetical protein
MLCCCLCFILWLAYQGRWDTALGHGIYTYYLLLPATIHIHTLGCREGQQWSLQQRVFSFKDQWAFEPWLCTDKATPPSLIHIHCPQQLYKHPYPNSQTSPANLPTYLTNYFATTKPANKSNNPQARCHIHTPAPLSQNARTARPSTQTSTHASRLEPHSPSPEDIPYPLHQYIQSRTHTCIFAHLLHYRKYGVDYRDFHPGELLLRVSRYTCSRV